MYLSSKLNFLLNVFFSWLEILSSGAPQNNGEKDEDEIPFNFLLFLRS